MEARLYRELAHPLVRYGAGALAVLFFLVLAFVLMPPIVRLAGPPPDLGFLGYGPARVASFFAGLGARGRELYRLFLLADLLFAPLYGLVLAGWLFFLYGSPAYARWPLVAALLDLGEDLLLLAEFGGVRPSLATVAGYLTFFKWILLAYTAFALFSGVLRLRRRAP